MPVAALMLILGAAVCHASWNYMAKGARGGLGFAAATVVCSVLIMAPLTAGIVLFADPDFGWRGVALVAVSGLLHTLYFHVLTEGYTRGDLSVVYPLSRGTGPLFAVIGAVLLLDERPAPLAIAGVTLIIAGVMIISLPRHVDTRRALPSIAFALATGVCIAVYTLWDKRAVDDVTPVLYGLGIDIARLVWLAPLLAALPALRTDAVASFNDHRAAVIGIAALTPAAYLLVLVAFTMAPVSYVAPAREVSILFGAALGLGVLGEGFAAQRVGGATAIVAGLAALAMA